MKDSKVQHVALRIRSAHKFHQAALADALKQTDDDEKQAEALHVLLAAFNELKAAIESINTLTR